MGRHRDGRFVGRSGNGAERQAQQSRFLHKCPVILANGQPCGAEHPASSYSSTQHCLGRGLLPSRRQICTHPLAGQDLLCEIERMPQRLQPAAPPTCRAQFSGQLDTETLSLFPALQDACLPESRDTSLRGVSEAAVEAEGPLLWALKLRHSIPAVILWSGTARLHHLSQRRGAQGFVWHDGQAFEAVTDDRHPARQERWPKAHRNA